MASLTLIAAVARNRVIGIDNKLPWHLPEDMAYFREVTRGHPVIMGRKTWESLPPRFRPLPGRQNIVVTRQADFAAPGAVLAHGLEDAVALAQGAEAFLIGGADLYRQALPLADRLMLTKVDLAPLGDAWFPEVDPATWQETSRDSRVGADGTVFAFVIYLRRQAA